MRFYHMDIAPTVLHLMDVTTNATFMAGADRSEPNAPGSPLVNNPTDVAVLRHAVWSRSRPMVLCKDGILVGGSDQGLAVGGHDVPLLENGRPRVGLASDQALGVLVGTRNLTTMFTSADGIVEKIDHWRHGGQALLVQPLSGIDPMHQFEVSWIGRGGAMARLAEVPRL